MLLVISFWVLDILALFHYEYIPNIPSQNIYLSKFLWCHVYHYPHYLLCSKHTEYRYLSVIMIRCSLTFFTLSNVTLLCYTSKFQSIMAGSHLIKIPESTFKDRHYTNVQIEIVFLEPRFNSCFWYHSSYYKASVFVSSYIFCN